MFRSLVGFSPIHFATDEIDPDSIAPYPIDPEVAREATQAACIGGSDSNTPIRSTYGRFSSSMAQLASRRPAPSSTTPAVVSAAVPLRPAAPSGFEIGHIAATLRGMFANRYAGLKKDAIWTYVPLPHLGMTILLENLQASSDRNQPAAHYCLIVTEKHGGHSFRTLALEIHLPDWQENDWRHASGFDDERYHKLSDGGVAPKGISSSSMNFYLADAARRFGGGKSDTFSLRLSHEGTSEVVTFRLLRKERRWIVD